MDDRRSEVMKELLTPAQFTQVSQLIMVTVAGTFMEDKTRLIANPHAFKNAPTRDEIKRRTVMAHKWFMVMRADIGYSTQRACDMLPEAVRAQLDGVDWEPPAIEKAWGGPREIPNV